MLLHMPRCYLYKIYAAFYVRSVHGINPLLGLSVAEMCSSQITHHEELSLEADQEDKMQHTIPQRFNKELLSQIAIAVDIIKSYYY